jgi:hypothetical protein
MPDELYFNSTCVSEWMRAELPVSLGNLQLYRSILRADAGLCRRYGLRRDDAPASIPEQDAWLASGAENQPGSSSGSLAMLAAIRLASSRVSSLPVGTTTGLVLAIDEGQCLLVGVAHDEARGGLLDCYRIRQSSFCQEPGLSHRPLVRPVP